MRHKSPLRYPGGKAKLVRFIQELFNTNRLSDGHYAEPYAGGASVALSLLYDEYARHVHINDLDRSVFAFWWAALERTEQLVRSIRDTPLTLKHWRRQKAVQIRKEGADLLELGFSTFYLNRTSRSGIISSGGVIGGKDQKGPWTMDARFNKPELIKRIERLADYRSRITLTNLDAIDFLAHLSTSLPEKSLTYLDPPYFAKGQRLYANHYQPSDHQQIADLMGSYPRCWLVSYDYQPEIISLYHRYRCLIYSLRYTAAARQRGSEIMFFSGDLQIPETESLPQVQALPNSNSGLLEPKHSRKQSETRRAVLALGRQ
jgi:DNA adenine methylase